jgi:hypothetical protein
MFRKRAGEQWDDDGWVRSWLWLGVVLAGLVVAVGFGTDLGWMDMVGVVSVALLAWFAALVAEIDQQRDRSQH